MTTVNLSVLDLETVFKANTGVPMLDPDITDAELARQSVREIEEHGWAAGQLITGDGRLCMAGAITAALVGYDNVRKQLGAKAIVRLQNSASRLAAFLQVPSVPWYNDAPNRTADECVFALKLFAEHCDG